MARSLASLSYTVPCKHSIISFVIAVWQQIEPWFMHSCIPGNRADDIATHCIQTTLVASTNVAYHYGCRLIKKHTTIDWLYSRTVTLIIWKYKRKLWNQRHVYKALVGLSRLCDPIIYKHDWQLCQHPVEAMPFNRKSECWSSWSQLTSRLHHWRCSPAQVLASCFAVWHLQTK